MTLEGIDFSWARPGGKAIAAAGKSFVVRYVPYSGDGGKGLTAAEVADYHRNGLDIALVFESTASRALAGSPGGVTDGQRVSEALAALNVPDTVPVYFAVDFDAGADQQGLIDTYLFGAASVLGQSRVGVYGSAALVKRCQASKSAAWFWQTYAWSGGKVADGVHLYQYLNNQRIGGGAVDLCRALQSDFGQWTSGVPQAPKVEGAIP